MEDPRIFFITGFHKSGTTWLMNMLGALPGVHCRGEGRFFASELRDVPSLYDSIEQGLRPWHRFQAHRKGNWIENASCLHTLHRQNVVSEEDYEAVFERDLHRLVHDTVSGYLVDRTTLPPGTTQVGDKTPVTSPGQLRRTLDVFPEAPILFLERDAKNVAVSLVLHFWRSMRGMRPDRCVRILNESDYLQADRFSEGNDPAGGLIQPRTAEKLARRWLATHEEAQRIRSRAPESLHFVPYEDLLTEPSVTLAKAARFISASPTDNELAQAVENNSRKAVQSAGGQLADHLRSSGRGDWEHYLSESASEAIEAVLAGRAD